MQVAPPNGCQWVLLDPVYILPTARLVPSACAATQQPAWVPIPAPQMAPAAAAAASGAGAQQQPEAAGSIRNFESLRESVVACSPSEVGAVLQAASFSLREQAFTALLSQCGKARQTDKAQAVFEALVKHFPALKANKFVYTALISALASGGRLDDALARFEEMKRRAAAGDRDLQPNVYTYSAVIRCVWVGVCVRVWGRASGGILISSSRHPSLFGLAARASSQQALS